MKAFKELRWLSHRDIYRLALQIYWYFLLEYLRQRWTNSGRSSLPICVSQEL